METNIGNVQERFDASPTAKISGNEIFTWKEPLDMRDIRKKVVPWMEQHGFIRDDYVNLDTGWGNIAITKNGIMSGLQHYSGPEKVQTFAALPKMIENGVFIRTRPGKDNQPGMKEHLFAAKLDIDGAQKLVGFVVKEDTRGRRYYDHEFTDINSLDRLSPHAGATRNDVREGSRTRQGEVVRAITEALASTNNITSGQQKINTQPENILPPPRERTINNIPEADHTPEFMRNRRVMILKHYFHIQDSSP